MVHLGFFCGAFRGVFGYLSGGFLVQNGVFLVQRGGGCFGMHHPAGGVAPRAAPYLGSSGVRFCSPACGDRVGWLGPYPAGRAPRDVEPPVGERLSALTVGVQELFDRGIRIVSLCHSWSAGSRGRTEPLLWGKHGVAKVDAMWGSLVLVAPLTKSSMSSGDKPLLLGRGGEHACFSLRTTQLVAVYPGPPRHVAVVGGPWMLADLAGCGGWH